MALQKRGYARAGQATPATGRKARDRIEHAAIDNDNTRRAYGRALGSFFAFLEDGGRQRVQDIGPLDVRDIPKLCLVRNSYPRTENKRLC